MDRKRIVLVHAYRHSMAPIDEVFRVGWPEAEIVNILDESLYSDAAPDGTLAPSVHGRLKSLFQHCILSGAKAIVFTGSTFGPAVDDARRDIPVPVLKADEAMAELAAARGPRILVVCTAARAIPIIQRNIDAAAANSDLSLHIEATCVVGAKDAIIDGRLTDHNRLVGEAIEVAALSGQYDVIVVGQISMVPALRMLSPNAVSRVITSPSASLAKLRSMLEPCAR